VMLQAVASNFGADQTLKGVSLVGPGNSFYQAYAGGNSYNASPNRPVDVLGSNGAIGYAPYSGAIGLPGSDIQIAPTTYDLADLQTIGDNQIAGNSAPVIAVVNARVVNGRNRVQSVTASGTTFTTPQAHNLSVNDLVRFDVTGGTALSGINLKNEYIVLSTPLSTTFTVGIWAAGAAGSAVNGGSAGSGTTNVGWAGTHTDPGDQSSIFTNLNSQITRWQSYLTNFSPAPAGGVPGVRWYEGALEPGAPSAAQCTAISLVTPSVPVPVTGTTHGTTTVDGISSTAGIYVGMAVSATDITGGQLVTVVGANSVTLSAVASGSSTETVTFSGTAALASSNIAAAILAWKNDASASLAIQAYYNSFMGFDSNYISFGAMPQSVAPSWLVLLGPGVFNLSNSAVLTAPQPYQLYYGFQSFSATP
jgi:hypothetical protein